MALFTVFMLLRTQLFPRNLLPSLYSPSTYSRTVTILPSKESTHGIESVEDEAANAAGIVPGGVVSCCTGIRADLGLDPVIVGGDVCKHVGRITTVGVYAKNMLLLAAKKSCSLLE